MAGWGRRFDPEGRRRMSRPVGCLLWLIALLVLLIAAAVIFGGFQRGTKVSAKPPLPVPVAAALVAGGVAAAGGGTA